MKEILFLQKGKEKDTASNYKARYFLLDFKITVLLQSLIATIVLSYITSLRVLTALVRYRKFAEEK